MNLLIFGKNLYDKSIYKKQILDRKEQEPNYSVYHLDNIDYEKLSNEIGSFDMFQEEKNVGISEFLSSFVKPFLASPGTGNLSKSGGMLKGFFLSIKNSSPCSDLFFPTKASWVVPHE